MFAWNKHDDDDETLTNRTALSKAFGVNHGRPTLSVVLTYRILADALDSGEYVGRLWEIHI